MSEQFYVYIMSNWNGRVLYVGFASDLIKRIYEHKTKAATGFTAKYNINKLVYFEVGEDFDSVLAREKEIKKWRREKKDRLIDTKNPERIDLFDSL